MGLGGDNKRNLKKKKKKTKTGKTEPCMTKNLDLFLWTMRGWHMFLDREVAIFFVGIGV
jgi:hypothetical protein